MAINLISCEHFGEAMERIGREHVPNRWLYRGQTHRRKIHQFTEENRAFEFENLYPQSFRFVARHAKISDALTEECQREDTKAEVQFNAFNAFLTSKYEANRRAESDRFAWMDPYAEEFKRLFEHTERSLFSAFHETGIGAKNVEFIRLSWALAQHYGVVTALLDLTFNPYVAAWFATNIWDSPTNAPLLNGEGIIYRLEVPSLLVGLDLYNSALKAKSGTNIYKLPIDKGFVQDLRHIPAAFALRPIRQEAAVVSGFDALKFVSLFNGAGKIDAFIFTHHENQILRWPIKHPHEYLVPPDDPFLDLKTEFDLKWKPRALDLYAKFTGPVIILTDNGHKLANVSDEVAEAEREQLYQSGMTSLGADLEEAENKFRAVIKMATKGVANRLSSLAHVRIAMILLRNDLSGTEEALGKALDGPDQSPRESWCGHVLQTVAQGAVELRKRGKGKLILPLVKRLAGIAHRAGPEALAREAEISARVLIGALELEQGNALQGLASLESVTRIPLPGLTLPQRYWVAFALQALAETNEALGEKERASVFLRDIIAHFGDDSLASTAEIVAFARAHS